MKSVWKEWPRIARRLGPDQRKLLLLDFDGTLASIQKTPGEVRLSQSTETRLEMLCARKDFRLVIVTGRRIADVRKYFRKLRKMSFIGNHGLEFRGTGLTAPPAARMAARFQGYLRILVKKLKDDFHYLPGILVENKGCTASLHFRNLPKEDWGVFNEVLQFFKQHYRNYPVVWKKGKKVWEIFPDTPWDKGEAASYILKKFSRSIPIVVGDDRTDEDMFRALKSRGITVRVGYRKNSHADYYLHSQKEIDRFLEKLCR